MQDSLILRDSYGKILGKLDNTFISDEDEHWQDHKVSPDDMLFPRHDQGKSSPVTVWNMYDNK